MISVIGGGTGTYTVLKGLKKHNVDLTAIVSMFDSGGSSGVLRDEYGDLPFGDIGKCILALADEKEIFLMGIARRRIERGSLNPHTFMNLFLKFAQEFDGSFIGGIERVSKEYGVKGRVLPVTTDNAHLNATLDDCSKIIGETNIDIPKHDGNKRIINLELTSRAVISEDAERALLGSRIIVIGPGDLYSSIIPNLLVDGVKEAIYKSNALVVYVCNLVTKFGETNGYYVEDHVDEINKYLEYKVDYVIVNNLLPKEETLRKYAEQKSFPVKRRNCDDIDGRIVLCDVASSKDLYRHDCDKLAEVILDLI